MRPFIQVYGRERTRNTVMAALYIATGRNWKSPISAPEIRRHALELIRSYGEEGSISTRMIHGILSSEDVVEVFNGRYNRYKLRTRF